MATNRTLPENSASVAVDGRPPRVYVNAYPLNRRRDRPRLPHLQRDGHAVIPILNVLYKRGFEYGGLLFNEPPGPNEAMDPIHFDVSTLGRDDLIVQPTRSGKDDMTEGDKCYVPTGKNTLEEQCFARLADHLPCCARSKVIVADQHALAFPEVAKRQHLLFHQAHGAAIHRFRAFGSNTWQKPPDNARITVAFLIYEKHIWPDGPALLYAFAMSGVDTLIWTHFLASQYPSLIGSVPFVMAEIVTPRKIPRRPQTLAFAKAWKIRLLTHDADQINNA